MDEKQPEKPMPPPSAMDDLAEGFETIRNFRIGLIKVLMVVVPVVAVIYGAVAWKPYYLLLGLAAIVLLFVLKRMDHSRSQEREPPTE